MIPASRTTSWRNGCRGMTPAALQTATVVRRVISVASRHLEPWQRADRPTVLLDANPLEDTSVRRIHAVITATLRQNCVRSATARAKAAAQQ